MGAIERDQKEKVKPKLVEKIKTKISRKNVDESNCFIKTIEFHLFACNSKYWLYSYTYKNYATESVKITMRILFGGVYVPYNGM